MNLVNQMANYYMNNQMQGLMHNLEQRLQQTNPQMFQLYQTAKQQNANPSDMLKQITKNYDENTMKQFKEQARQFGIADDILNQI